MTGSIVVVGSLNMDLVVFAPRHPQIGETLVGKEFGTFLGGKGANQAVAAARLGAMVRMVGRVGADPHGDTLLRALAKEGVDTTYVLRESHAPTGVALVTVDNSGRNTIVIVPGANGHLSVEDISSAEGAFKGAALLLLQLECPLKVVAYAAEVAQRHGVRVILNPAPAQPLDPELLKRVDYLIPNQTELALLTHLDGVSEAVDQLRARGVHRIVVTLGQEGALVAEGDHHTILPAYPVPMVDSTAAGDAFVGGFAVALSEGHSILEAARWGNAAGAVAVTRVGAQASLPTRGEMEALLSNSRSKPLPP